MWGSVEAVGLCLELHVPRKMRLRVPGTILGNLGEMVRVPWAGHGKLAKGAAEAAAGSH